MWVPSKVIDWFTTLQDAADVNSETASAALQDLREELSAVRAERDALKLQMTVSQTNFDWLRMQVNTLQMERTALMEKAYGIKIPAPELVRTPIIEDPNMTEKNFSFEDLGDNIAKALGYPTYDKQ